MHYGNRLLQTRSLMVRMQKRDQRFVTNFVTAVPKSAYLCSRILEKSPGTTITAPGNDPYVVTVGAMKPMGTPNRSDDLIASYSSKGPTLLDHVVKPDLVATGNRVISVEAQLPIWQRFQPPI